MNLLSPVIARSHRRGNLLIRPSEVFNAQRCCRSAVEDPDMCLCLSPSCRTLRVPAYEMTCLTRFKLQRAGPIVRAFVQAMALDQSTKTGCPHRARNDLLGPVIARSQRRGNLLIRPSEVFNAQRCCRSAVEDPDMGLCLNPSCRTLRVPTYEMTCLTRFKLQRAGSIVTAFVQAMALDQSTKTGWPRRARTDNPEARALTTWTHTT